MTIFAANRGGEAAPRIDASTPERALITRPEADVVVRHLPTDAAHFITCLMAGRSLGEAAEETLRSYERFDVSAGLSIVIEADAFASLIFGDEE